MHTETIARRAAQAAARFALESLTLDGKAIAFSRAWLEREGGDLAGAWSGSVQGAGGLELMEAPELRLAAVTTDGRRVVGRAFVPAASLSGDEFRLQGVDALLVDGCAPDAAPEKSPVQAGVRPPSWATGERVRAKKPSARAQASLAASTS